MQTRRYPRTLDEAFPFGPAYGCAIEHTRSPAYGRAWWACMAVVAAATLVLCWSGA